MTATEAAPRSIGALLEKTVDLLRQETEEGVDGELRDLDTQIDKIFNLAGPEATANVETFVKDDLLKRDWKQYQYDPPKLETWPDDYPWPKDPLGD